MDMYALEKLEHAICKELDQVSEEISQKGEFSPGTLEAVHKLTDTLKNIYKIHMLKDEVEDGYSRGRYSRDGSWEAHINGNYGRGRSYNEGGSSYGGYSGRHYVRGHYSRDGMGGRDRRYSHDDAKGEMMEQLQEMMENAPSDKSRQAIERCMETVRNS